MAHSLVEILCNGPKDVEGEILLYFGSIRKVKGFAKLRNHSLDINLKCVGFRGENGI